MERQITDEHGGLSIAIASATNKLKNKLKLIWLRMELKSNDLACSSDCIPLHRYKSKFLPTEAEVCLLICSIFPDDYRIQVEDLVIYGMGLELFEDVHDMFAARCRVHDIISMINDKRYLRKKVGGIIRLANEKDEPCNQYVKMLDGGRDLARSIPSRIRLVFHREIIIEKWSKSVSYKDCYGLSLVLKKVNEHPVDLKWPKLTLLQLQYREDSQSIPVDFFEGMKELRVLSLDVPSLPQSLNVLRNLRTLRLKALKVEDMSWIGGLINLEFLSIFVLRLTDIPREMGQLENLRLLDLRKMNIAYIPAGVLSRLFKLEELYFPLSFKGWGCKPKQYDEYDEWESGIEDNSDDEERINANISGIHDGERINASLTEIVSLSLNALQISVPKASIFPKKSPVFEKIREFKIIVPNNLKYQPFGKGSINELQLTGEAGDIKESGICNLMSRTQDLSLIRVRNLKNVIYQLEQNDFSQLRKMIISECDELEYVVDTKKMQIMSEGDCLFRKLECLYLSMLPNLKEICHGRWTTFPWLSHISIRFCHKLKYVFPLSIVRGLMLKSIEILDCKEIEEIIFDDEEDNIPYKLCSIENLDLHSLPMLISFLVQKDNMINGVHDDINESLTTNKIVSNYAKGSISTCDGYSKPSPTSKSTLIFNESCNDDEELICAPSTSTSGAKLQKSDTQQLNSHKQVSVIENKDVIDHMKMYTAFTSKLAEKWLRNLKRLKIAFCDAVKVVFWFEENYAISRAFDSLKELELYGLRNLVHIWFHILPKITAFQNLQLLVLSECSNLYLFSSRVAKLLVQLQKLYISRCEKMEEIVVKDDEDEIKDKIVFPQLKLLELQRIPNLMIFMVGIDEIELPSLECLKLNQCNKMKSFSYGLLRTPKLEKLEINGRLYSLMGDINTTIMSCKGYLHCQCFSFADLKIATKNFRPDDLLGEGGSGKFYKGWIDENTFAPFETSIGIPVAIKILNSESLQMVTKWRSEVIFLGTLSHPNLVKLLGYCLEDRKLLLVYEFMQRGSLENNLFTDNSLSWDMRIKIAIGAARGLDFLHREKKIIHRFIKPSHILLDGNYNAKISNFRLAIPGPSDGDSYVTTMFFGTYGYAAPEYVATGHLYVKSDVYSFGVVLLQLITGLRLLDRKRPRGQQNLVDWLKPILPLKRMLRTIIDVRIEGQYSSEAMLLAVELCLKCLESETKSRPSMKEAVDTLQQIEVMRKNK
ncbi:uncharacterized protein [Euphorbia lathyris]|uniref:uncharacterized protein n=1 Tax=Euphorbia lathyris TaxID=212925 RepID=UPI003313479A